MSAYRCGCGHVFWDEDDAELLEAVRRHVRERHPELVNTLSPLELARPEPDDEDAAA